MADPTPTGILYTATTLAAHIRGTFNCDADAAGGAAPDRITNAIIACGQRLWNGWDWEFRRKRGTLAVVAGTATGTVPLDFAKLDQNWLRNLETTNQELLFMSDRARFQEIADQYESDATGPPVAATTLWDHTTVKWTFIWTPTADAAYSYLYWYLTADPWTTGAVTGNTIVPPFPGTFHWGWRLLSEAFCLENYTRSTEAIAKKREFQDWLTDQLDEGDETVNASEMIEDAYRDTPLSLFGNLPTGTGILWR